MATKHTPGPWRFERKDGRRHIYPASGGSIMCDEKYYPWVPDKDEDWQLIAAAPDMLAALEYAYECLSQNDSYVGDPLLAKIHAAIAKAKGQAE